MVSLKGGLKRVVIQQLKALGTVGFPIPKYDAETKEFYQPGLTVQFAGLTYDSAYEMALLVSPAYWLTFYMGVFTL